MSNATIDIPQKSGFAKKLWRLTWPYFKSSEWKIAWVLLVAVIGLSLGRVYLGVLFNEWHRDFFNALQQKDLSPTVVRLGEMVLWETNRFFYLVAKFMLLALFAIAAGVYAAYLGQILQIRWRKWMTEDLTNKWLLNRAYYRLELIGSKTDNPEQRIEADVNGFTDDTLDLTLSLLRNIVNVVTFIIVLWGLSGPLSFSIGALELYVPGYMVWLAIVYAVGGTAITFWLGSPLVGINFERQRFGASFRFRLGRVRENCESVAMYGGERREAEGFRQSFGDIWRNWWRYMILTKRLNWFILFFDNLTVLFPYLVAARRFFAGEIDFGTIFQVANAFGRVQDSLSWFITLFQRLANWKATTDRLTTFVEAVDRAQQESRSTELAIAETPATIVSLQDAQLSLPDGRVLLNDIDINIGQGEKILISGPSGSGKTTLFRLLSGLWPFAKGKLHVPKGAKPLFLSQRPYLPLGTLREAVAFPADPANIPEADIRSVLEDVRLCQLVDRLDEQGNWSMTLSIGEQQRLAIARALLIRPDWLFLDEATAALDEENERHMYELLSSRLPGSTIISIAHRPTVATFHHRRFTIDPQRKAVTSEVLVPAK